jgi:hypothetical protein
MEIRRHGNSRSLYCIWQKSGSTFRKPEGTNLTTLA